MVQMNPVGGVKASLPVSKMQYLGLEVAGLDSGESTPHSEA